MRHYELMLVLRPDLESDDVSQVVAVVSDAIAGSEGQVGAVGQLADKKGTIAAVDEDGWRTRRLAYVINGCRDGYYVIVQYSAEPTQVEHVERLLNIRDDVLRHLTVRIEDQDLVDLAPPPAPSETSASSSSADGAGAETEVAADSGAGAKEPEAAEEEAAVPGADVDTESAEEEAVVPGADVDTESAEENVVPGADVDTEAAEEDPDVDTQSAEEDVVPGADADTESVEADDTPA